MREILFRGKRLDNGEWVEGWYQHETTIKHWNGSQETVGVTIAYKVEEGFLEDTLVDPPTVGQYTGLNDKHGKRIFEGDILLLDDINGIVNYGTGCFCVKLSGPDYLYHNNPAIDIVLNEYPGLEVIGNIHDNPEPLKGGEG